LASQRVANLTLSHSSLEITEMKWIRRTGVLALVVALSGTAVAGDYHTGATLDCKQCHIMHFSQSHAYSALGGSSIFPGLGSTAQEFLLRDTVNNLCLACHDNNSSYPDVYGPVNSGKSPTDVRLAGFLNRVGDATEASGHTLESMDTPPGGTWTPGSHGLSCTDCHHQHGYAGFGQPFGETNYRNLVAAPGNASANAFVTYNDGAWGTDPLNTRDVFERMQARYDESQVDYYEPDTTKSVYAEWCGGCHTNFHGDVGGAEIGGSKASGGFIRHPSADVNLGDIGGGHSSMSVFAANVSHVKVLSASGNWDGQGVANDITPSCMSCHKAHGNGNEFGLIYRDGANPTITENGSLGGVYVDLCNQCHVQGG
jgi:hypothetical protein